MSEEILINGKKITELSDMFFEYCKLKKENERLQKENEELKKQLNLYMSQYEIKIPNKYRQALEEIKIVIDEVLK